MKAIVAVDKNWGIGYRGDLLVKISDDMKFFKQTTVGKVVVMGRETFDSLPGKAPLKDRVNIVLSTRAQFCADGVIICRSLDELGKVLQQYPTEDVFIIGGEQVYRQLLPYCTEAYVTKIENAYQADKFFIDLDREKGWEQVDCSECKRQGLLRYNFTKYVNGKPASYIAG